MKVSKLSHNRELICLFAGIVIIAVFYFMPPFEGMKHSAMVLLGIFATLVFLWIAVGISWPSLFGLMMLPLLIPEISMNAFIASSVGNPSFSFLMFTFCVSYGLNKTQFIHRCAIGFLSLKITKKGPWYFLAFYFLSILILGSCMSTTVIVLIYLAINEELFATMNLKKGDKFAALMTMGLIITAGISGAMTPIAHVFPLTAISIYQSITGQTISYVAYIAAGVPVALLAVGVMMVIFRFVLNPDTGHLMTNNAGSFKLTPPPPPDEREKIAVSIFFLVVALWISPDLVRPVFPAFSKFFDRFGTVLPPLLGVILLCVIRIKGEPIIELGDAAKSVPWPSLFMATCCMALGVGITNKDIGFSAWLSVSLGPLTRSLQGIVLVGVLVLITGLFTNVGSNMVAVSVACAVGVPIALSLENVHAGALAVVLGMASTYAFAMPPAMTTVVLGISTGWTTVSQMARYGFLVAVPCMIFITFIAYPIAILLL